MKIARWLPLLCASIVSVFASLSHAKPYTLNEAVMYAQKADPWITGSVKRQESLAAMSMAANTLPDPTVSVGLANLPVDTFDFDQENMTQLKVGVSQLFPRGNTLSLEQERLQTLSQTEPYAREDRKAQVAMRVAHLWLEAYRNEKTIQLIEKDRGLFAYLVDVAQSNYTTALGRTRQQDFVRAQLEVTRLDDRLVQLHQQREMNLAKLSEWLNDSALSLLVQENNESQIHLLLPSLIAENKRSEAPSILLNRLMQHPKIRRIDWKIRAFDSATELAKQGYKPQWGLNAGYGYRDQTPMGADRADFFSVGMTFDVPLFTANRQDKKVQSAQAELAAVKAERLLALRQLKSGYETAEAKYLRLVERTSLFNSRLLKKMVQQAEASLSAYTNDDGDFAEAVRARIATLNAQVEALDIDIDRQKTVAQLNYFHAGAYSTNERAGNEASHK